VIGEFRQTRLRVAGVQHLECLADPAVKLDTARRGQALVQRLADERVPEAQPSVRSGYGSQQAGADGLVQHVEQLVAADHAHLLKGVERELPPSTDASVKT